MKAIYGQELAPSLADRYLAEQGYDAQQTSEPVSPNRPDDLFEPVPGPFAARGIFTDRAKDVSVQTWIDLHRKSVAFLAAGLAGIAALLAVKRAT